MKIKYDEYYEQENLFGDPYPELIEFFSKMQERGKLLDLGCGQGRDSIALAKIGFEVIGVDHSKVGINQLNRIAIEKKLALKGIVADVFEFNAYGDFDYVLLDSMFHFGKKEKEKEIRLLKRIIEKTKSNTLITICIQNTGNKLEVLNSVLFLEQGTSMVNSQSIVYKFRDEETNHCSKTSYEIVTIKKNKISERQDIESSKSG